MLIIVLRTLLRRALAWDPSRSRHPYLFLLWIAIVASLVLLA